MASRREVARIAGRRMYLRRAVDHEGEILDLPFRHRRDTSAALSLMRKLLKKQGFVPKLLVIDKLGSCGSAFQLPMAVAILLCLFAAQGRGTARIGTVFGPLMLLWFVVIAVLGLGGILRGPNVLAAVDPRHAITFLAQDGWGGFAVLGGVFLAITGGEALYADMGHIGRNPIRTTWYGIVLPALLINYAGQTALLLDDPILSGNPFFKLAPDWAIFPPRAARDGCDHHRQPSHHYRLVLADAPGDAARLVPRLAYPPDLG